MTGDEKQRNDKWLDGVKRRDETWVRDKRRGVWPNIVKLI